MNRISRAFRYVAVITSGAALLLNDSTAQEHGSNLSAANTWAAKTMETAHATRGTNVFANPESIPQDAIDDCGWWIEHLLKSQYRPTDFKAVTEFVRDPKPGFDEAWTRYRTSDGAEIKLVQSCGSFTLAIKPPWNTRNGLSNKEAAASFAQQVLKTYLDEGDEAAHALFGWSRFEGGKWHFRPHPPGHEGWMENSDVDTDGMVVRIAANKRRSDVPLKPKVETYYDKLNNWFDPPDKRPHEPYRATRVIGLGYTDLYYAIKEGINNNDLSVPKAMIATNPSLVSASMGPEGYMPLHMAAGYGSVDLVQFLLAQGADLEARDKSGRTPLYVAATYNRKEVLEALITDGADINAKDKDGKTPLDVTQEPPYASDAANILHEHGAKSTRPEIPALLKRPVH